MTVIPSLTHSHYHPKLTVLHNSEIPHIEYTQRLNQFIFTRFCLSYYDSFFLLFWCVFVISSCTQSFSFRLINDAFLQNRLIRFVVLYSRHKTLHDIHIWRIPPEVPLYFFILYFLYSVSVRCILCYVIHCT